MAATLGGAATLCAVGAGFSSAQAACVSESYQWEGGPRMQYDILLSFGTGVTIPGPAAGETLRILSATGTAYDQYPDQSDFDRIAADQQHESWTFSVGGTVFGALTPDLPDSPEEGAATPWYSGVQTHDFGSGAVAGGEVVVLHSSLFGFTESPNSLTVTSLDIVVERCVEDAPTTTAETTTTAAQSTTTTVESGGPTTTAGTTTTTAATTTSTTASTVGQGGPVPTNPSTTTGGSVAQLGPTQLPATGADSKDTFLLGLAALLGGGALVLATRRRPRTQP